MHICAICDHSYFSDGNKTVTVLDRSKLDKFNRDGPGLYSLFMESRTLTKKKCWHFDTSFKYSHASNNGILGSI